MKTPKGYHKYQIEGGFYIFRYEIIGSDIVEDEFELGICLN